jgi:hypothetical protein
MENQGVELFAKQLIEKVRDRAIMNCDGYLTADKLYAAAVGPGSQFSRAEFDRLVQYVISNSVDTTLFYLCLSIDYGELNLRYSADNGDDLNLTEAGEQEMAGWYAMLDNEEGWRQRFSKERIQDDFGD